MSSFIVCVRVSLCLIYLQRISLFRFRCLLQWELNMASRHRNGSYALRNILIYIKHFVFHTYHLSHSLSLLNAFELANWSRRHSLLCEPYMYIHISCLSGVVVFCYVLFFFPAVIKNAAASVFNAFAEQWSKSTVPCMHRTRHSKWETYITYIIHMDVYCVCTNKT